MKKKSAAFAKRALVVAILLAMAGCAQEAGVTTQGTAVTRNGCTIDLKPVCVAFFHQPEFEVNGVKYDLRSFEQNSRRHEDVVIPYNYPNGDLLATVQCQIDTQKHEITQARLAEGPPIDDKAVAYLRSKGLCADQSPDYNKATKAASDARNP